jgi:glycoprotein endo-alpha-1,2-mannosidase
MLCRLCRRRTCAITLVLGSLTFGFELWTLQRQQLVHRSVKPKVSIPSPHEAPPPPHPHRIPLPSPPQNVPPPQHLPSPIPLLTPPQDVDSSVIAFYYPWYGAPQTDGHWLHWNHEFLPHWEKRVTDRFPKGRHKPPEDLGSTYYPELGPYSSRDPSVIDAHMRQLARAGVGSLAVSWYPRGLADDHGQPESADGLVPTLLDHAHAHGLKLCLHIEPYANRNALSVKNDLSYISRTYGTHAALLRHGRRQLPVVFVYDSYLVPATSWATVFRSGAAASVRGTAIDAVVIGLLLKGDAAERDALVASGFDGFYTYFASRRFTFGSEWKHWPQLAAFATQHELLFVPSVGPGYDDTRVRPWNGQNTQSRRRGAYYNESFAAALSTHAPLVSITSFNEWHEGTQIETAVAHQGYPDYGGGGEQFYLQLTRALVERRRRTVSEEHVRARRAR